MANTPSIDDAKQYLPEITVGAIVLALVASYWNTLWELSGYWEKPEYSHGYLVPLFTFVLLYLRWKPIRAEDADSAARWWGVGLITFGLLVRVLAAALNFLLIDGLTLIPCLLGAFLIVGGRATLRWAGPAIAFLIFMYPMPGPVARRVLEPLQRVATVSSTVALQTMGIEAYREGNTIQISDQEHDVHLGVVEQCSGLRMLTIFVALSVALTLISPRPWWESLIIVLSAVPIALTVNVIRITVTGLLHLWVGEELANAVFHDFAGWVMMPMALALLYLEIYVLGQLVIEEEAAPSTVRLGPGFGR